VPLADGFPGGRGDLTLPIVDPLVELELTEFSPWVDDDWESGGLLVTALKASETDSPYCEVAVFTDEGVALCPTELRRRACGSGQRCLNIESDRNACGDCETSCGSDGYCDSGACTTCPRVRRQLNPSLCDAECPPGATGIYCDTFCPGQVGEGIYCSGRGTCDDGVYGSATCACDEGYHGDACELSCSDGEPNGRETAADCGGPCAPCPWESGD
jgi:hypothetical protein